MFIKFSFNILYRARGCNKKDFKFSGRIIKGFQVQKVKKTSKKTNLKCFV